MLYIGQDSCCGKELPAGIGEEILEHEQLAEGSLPVEVWYCQNCQHLDFYLAGNSLRE